uniref:Uncharacterized protein n=1 Tax=Amphimedon queenslandica TaxID=400682 RepID=A0A1X7V7W0_AMPQE
SRQPSRRYNSGTQEYTHSSPKELYRQQYYEVIDLLVNEIDRRFDQETFSILQEMETLVIQSCNNKKPTPSSRFSSMYNDDFHQLSHQLEMLQDLVTTANKDFAERSLSALCRLKSYLRTTVTQQCLSHHRGPQSSRANRSVGSH